MRRVSWSLTAAVLPFLVLACAHAAGTTAGTRGGMTAIGSDEITTANVRTAYEAVQRLRPTWLQSRGSRSTGGQATLPAVFLNGNPYGDVESLRQIEAVDVASIEYLNPADATTHYGTGYPGGIIDVRTH